MVSLALSSASAEPPVLSGARLAKGLAQLPSPVMSLPVALLTYQTGSVTSKLTMPVVTLPRPCSSVIVYWKDAPPRPLPAKPVVGVKVKVPSPLLTIAPLTALLTPEMTRLISAPSGSTSLPSSCAAVKVIGVLPTIDGIKSSKAIGVTSTEPGTRVTPFSVSVTEIPSASVVPRLVIRILVRTTSPGSNWPSLS